ncbi:MAG: hypothetical protein QG672_1544, partial [Pseudomonadota bacterium]|nr:hypothetical protein [Pseudomonadota bacterium]
IVLLLTGEAQS